MLKVVTSLIVGLSTSLAIASEFQKQLDEAMVEAKKRCHPPSKDEKYLKANDLKWGVTFDELKQKYNQVYHSGKRLKNRVYFDEKLNSFVVVHHNENVVPVTERIFKNVKLHIEKALKLDYAQFVIFSDMGHSHLLIPKKFYEEKIKPIPVKESHKIYQMAFDHPEIQVFYHTAEQIKQKDKDKGHVLPGAHNHFRYYTRNIAGDNKYLARIDIHKNLEAKYNTVHGVEGYQWWGAGFNLSASRDGCFPFTHNGKTYYFDISLDDLPYESDDGGFL